MGNFGANRASLSPSPGGIGMSIGNNLGETAWNRNRTGFNTLQQIRMAPAQKAYGNVHYVKKYVFH